MKTFDEYLNYCRTKRRNFVAERINRLSSTGMRILAQRVIKTDADFDALVRDWKAEIAYSDHCAYGI